MPRLARLDAPRIVHHVMIRGIERRNIFRDNTDRNDMVDRLADLLPVTNTSCYAWAFFRSEKRSYIQKAGKRIELKREVFSAIGQYVSWDSKGRKWRNAWV